MQSRIPVKLQAEWLVVENQLLVTWIWAAAFLDYDGFEGANKNFSKKTTI